MLRTTISADPSAAAKTPLLFVHGGSHTGACFVETPDGRAGWAALAAARGRTSYVLDWPGRGAAPPARDWPVMSMHAVAENVVEELRRIGPAVLVTHSMGGVIGWRAAELDATNVRAIVAIAPGPPANLQDPCDPAQAVDESKPAPVVRANALKMWANTERFPHAALDAYIASLVEESPRALNERSNLNGKGIHVAAEALAGIPIVVITGDRDPRHPREIDEAVARYFGAEFVWLPDRGITEHGHMMMIERGHDVIANLFLDWLDARNL